MSCGTPVIVSRTASLPELVEDGRTGWIVPPADAGALRQRLSDVHLNPALASVMGAAARQTVMERFVWSATAERCMNAYRRALAVRGRRRP